MAKKENAYSMFVKDEFNRLKKNGETVAYHSLFAKLSSKWKATAQDRKDYYKERAANWNSNGHTGQAAPQPSKPSTSSTTSSQHSEQKPSNMKSDIPNSDNPSCDTRESVEKKFAPSSEEHIDLKPVIKQERGLKRDLEVGIYFGDQEYEQNQEQPKKRWRDSYGIGKGFPNLKNIKTAPDSDSERYFDYHLLQLRTQCESIVTTRAANLLDTPIYTFSCNVLCKYKTDTKEIKFVPLEIGINTYSIKNGQIATPYHVIVDAGPPPRNYWNDTHDHMMASHKIKVTQAGVYPSSARNDYHGIYKEMLKYTYDGERTILVADNHDLEQTRMCIEWLHEMAEKSKIGRKYPKPSTWTILPLVDFVVAAYNHVHCNMLHYPLPKFTLHYYLKVRLETSIWDYDPDLMCPYHKRNENQTKWCARSCSIRVINALQLTFEEIFKNYNLAVNADNLKSQQEEAAQEMAAKDIYLQKMASQEIASQKMVNQEGVISTSGVPEQERVSAQQRQQPMHMPDERVRPPIIEEMIRNKERRDELLRQQQRMIESNYD